jgi:uncharacterized protein YcfL
MKIQNIFLICLMCVGVFFISGCLDTEDVDVQPTQEAIDDDSNTESPKEPVKKVKSADIEIAKVNYQMANLESVRVTLENTGDVSINPKFDIYIYDPSGTEIPTNSMFDEFGTISAGQSKTGEISVIEMFKEDGTYSIKVDLLDSDYNKLDTASKDFTINYWGKFQL